LLLLLLLLLALAACSGPDPVPPPHPGTLGRAVELDGRVPLRLELPPGYEVQSERGETFDVHWVWRVPPETFAKDTSLGLYIGKLITAYCPPGTGRFEPAAFPDPALGAGRRWHGCALPGTGRQAWELHLRDVAAETLHLFIIGTDADEFRRLRRIAETLTLLKR
jgi:hypothetical protein